MLQKHVESFGGETIDLSKPSVKGLAFLLRNPDLWPKGFEYDFGNCAQCAMGLARKVWEPAKQQYWSLEGHPNAENTAKLLNMSLDDATSIFIARGGRPYTPAALASDLEAL